MRLIPKGCEKSGLGKRPGAHSLGDYSVADLEKDVPNSWRVYLDTWNNLHATTYEGANWIALSNTGGIPAPLQR